MFSELTHASEKVVGLKQVLRVAAAGELARIYIAQDADADIRRQLVDAARAHNIKHTMVPTRKKLGEACGIDVPAACAAIKKC